MTKKTTLHLVDSETDKSGRPVIYHIAGSGHTAADQVLTAIAKYFPGLLVWAGRLCRIYVIEQPQSGNVRRDAGSLVLVSVVASHLAEMATRSANHKKWDKRLNGEVDIDCPMRIADMLLGRGHWPEIPELLGVIQAPTISLDGRVIDKSGFDRKSGLYCAAAPENLPGYKKFPHAATSGRAKGIQALEILLGLTKTFPFVADEDRTAFIAAILTGLLRRSLPSAPMFCITAPTPGTGKTLLAEIIGILVTGQRPAVLSLGLDETEAEKRLAGVFLAGDSVILIDNVERPLSGDLLCQVTTQPTIRFRPLGGSTVVTVPTNATLLATGNNLSILGDLQRRVVMIRLDANMERPEQRRFDENPLAIAKQRRGELIRAALHIVQSYIEAGSPAIDGLTPYGSFDLWDRMVRRALIWLGMVDPLNTSSAMRDLDPDLEITRQLYSAWREIFADEAVTAAQIVSRALEYQAHAQQHAHPELHDALQQVCSEKINTRRLAGWLKRHRDRIVDDNRLVMSGADNHAKVARWKVQCVKS
jgi:hypothetical protein